MFGVRWRMFRLFGIPIGIDASWFFIVALITWTLIRFFSIEIPGYTSATYVLLGLTTALIFFGCIVLHELGHAVIAKRNGIPIRGITLFLFGGVAEMDNEPPSARSEFLMAIAGPIVSLVLALLFFGAAEIVSSAGAPRLFAVPILYLAWINTIVLIFNMIPAFPLDGGRVLRSILWGMFDNLRKATRWASMCGQAFAWLLIAFGVLQLFAGNLVGGIWFGVIGLFLNGAARMSYQQVLVRQALQGETLRRFMNTEPITVSPHIDLHSWMEEFVYRYHHKMFPVVLDNLVQGVVTTHDLSAVPRDEWSNRTVAEIMQRDVDHLRLSPDADALEALEKMKRTNSSRLLVMEDQQLIGLVSLKDLMRFLDLKLELDQEGGSTSDMPRGLWRSHSRDESSVHPPG